MKLVTLYYGNGTKSLEYWKKKCGKKTGLYKEWHNNGNMADEKYYRNGKLEGLRKTYFHDGLSCMEAYYINGRIHGLFKQWYTSGNMGEEGNMINGRMDGEQKIWHHRGRLETYMYHMPHKIIYLETRIRAFKILKNLVINKKKKRIRKRLLEVRHKITLLNNIIYDCILSYLEEKEKIEILRGVKQINLSNSIV